MKKTPKASSSTAAKRKASRKAGSASRPASAPSARLAALAPKRSAGGHDVPADAKATIRRLKSQLAEARARITELEASADTDFLLGIFNRRGFERELQRAIAYIRRYHAGGALIVLDVDRLKPINDAFGHAAGDAVLKAVVAALLRHVRASDLIGRLGGDEFALLLWNLSETDAKAKAASLEETIDGLTFTFRGHAITAGASAGVAVLGPHSDAETALEQADSAMYVRKAQRRRG
ncbi:MAG: GGDEF domain-containing protein [Rhizobiales bacterium]|nr:GGDEF domain-containing protein [Hyphomicrobiales bacterium]